MIYLLDVNVLIALGFQFHSFHDRVALWLQAEGFPPIATCSITELGFVRVLAQNPHYGLSVTQAVALLKQFKRGSTCEVVHVRDDHGAADLPGWVNTPKRITDGHLLQLASARGLTLATLDEKIPGALVIPR
jgi:predicted nucleic acid-binding protein